MKRKTVFVFALGFMLAIGMNSAYAEIASMIGKQIDGQVPLKIDGIMSEHPAITVEGTSYIPLKAAGEIFDSKVSWIDGVVQVEQNQSSVDSSAESTEKTKQAQLEEEQLKAEGNKVNAINQINFRIDQKTKLKDDAEARIAELTQNADTHSTVTLKTVDGPKEISYKETNQYQQDLANIKIAQDEVTKLSNEIADLEAQKSQLEVAK